MKKGKMLFARALREVEMMGVFGRILGMAVLLTAAGCDAGDSLQPDWDATGDQRCGMATGGGSPSGASTGVSTRNTAYPCNGTTSGYDVVAIKSGSTWDVRSGDTSLYWGTRMQAAL